MLLLNLVREVSLITRNMQYDRNLRHVAGTGNRNLHRLERNPLRLLWPACNGTAVTRVVLPSSSNISDGTILHRRRMPIERDRCGRRQCCQDGGDDCLQIVGQEHFGKRRGSLVLTLGTSSL